jgi:putative DNA primase/helicase
MTSLEYALQLATIGYPVFPCNTDKKPRTSHGFKDATRDFDQITAWWEQWPDALIGVPTGTASGLYVLDVDVKPDKNGFDTLKRLGLTPPETWINSTPSGGAHYLFANPPGIRTKTDSNVIGQGIDRRGDGGYIIWWPAAGAKFTNAPLAPPPEWMLADPQPPGMAHPLKHIKSSAPIETPENIARVKSLLDAISADCGYDRWRNVVWAIASTGWSCGEGIAREWSMTAPDKFDDSEFDKTWHSFNPALADGIGYGSLIHYAKEAGWVDTVTTGSIETAHGDTAGDIKNGKAFAFMHRDNLLFVHETGDVLQFSKAAGWVHAPPGEEYRAGKDVVAAMRIYAAEQWKLNPEDTKVKRQMKHVDQSSTEQKICAMINMAKSEPGMTVRLSDLDADTMMLGVTNGVLDLRTGTLLRPSPSMLVTKRCPVPFDPSATAPILEAFITRITRGDPPLVKFLQRLAGYILTGEVKEHCFAFLYGLGRNGKTTYAEMLFWLLGDYAVILPTATLMMGKRDPGACTPDLMLLKGRRLALASELEESARFAEATIKSMTGGDTMTARNPYGLFVTWTPTHKLMIFGNHKPVISGTDHGIWRRIQLVPFNEQISDAECDGNLPENLRAEGAGVLNWALAGLRDWQSEGLNPPASVKAAVADYQSNMDIFAQWMDDHVIQSPGAQTPTATLYRAYLKWAEESGWKHTMTPNAFGRRLTERGITLIKAVANGICLNADGQRAAACFPGFTAG